MKDLIKELHQTKLVKVTGSFADGTNNENSDIDFWVKEDHPEHKFPEESNMQKIIKVLEKFNIKWHSSMTGYISTIGESNPELETELEFSNLWHKRPNKLSSITIKGNQFKTY